MKISGHKLPLHTEFHAIVNGTDGDTYLQPVKAPFLHSSLIARGYVVRVQGEPGRHVYLDVDMEQAQIEDLLRMGVRTDPPVIQGNLKLHTKLDLPGAGRAGCGAGTRREFEVVHSPVAGRLQPGGCELELVELAL